MKVEIIKVEEKFQPVELKLIFETKEELHGFRVLCRWSDSITDFVHKELSDLTNMENKKLIELLDLITEKLNK